MVFKQKDSQEAHVRALELRIKQSRDAQERARYEKSLGMLRGGAKGEKRSAYYIDFELKDSLNWAVIHDLRIELNGRVAQIDHLLINRLLEIYVVESKAFRTKIRYENGGWERLNLNDTWEGIESPVEQNERHIFVLKQLIETHQLAPSRFGLKPNFINIVAVQGSCSIIGKRPRNAKIERIDTLIKKILKEDISVFGLLKVISQETLRAFATTLVTYHQAVEPPKPAVALRDAPNIPLPQITVSGTQDSKLTTHNSAQTCQTCSRTLTSAEIKYCNVHASRFEGKLLCRPCQPLYSPTENPELNTQNSAEHSRQRRDPSVHEALERSPVLTVQPSGVAPNPKSQNAPAPQTCQTCSRTLTFAEIKYCKTHAPRFEGKLLCRPCQPLHSPTKNPKLKTQSSAEHSLESPHPPPQPQNPSVRITIAPRTPQTNPHPQNPALGPVKTPPACSAQRQTWEERVNEIKIAHPRAYEEWTRAEDNRLKDLFGGKATIPSIAIALQRQPTAIRARLRRFNLLPTVNGSALTDK